MQFRRRTTYTQSRMFKLVLTQIEKCIKVLAIRHIKDPVLFLFDVVVFVSGNITFTFFRNLLLLL